MSNPILASVIICTHNPRRDYLTATLKALQSQTLPKEQWELILVDNASEPPISESYSLDWHQHTRIIRESELGLSFARMRGIRESEAPLLVFVDDDNVLESDYLRTATQISETQTHIGAFGGSIRPEFELDPPAWAAPYIGGLAISEIKRDYWSNLYVWSAAQPFGVGMCVRREVADDYLRKLRSDPRRKLLGRRGSQLTAHEDTDLAWCAIDLGMGIARFSSLKVKHLISKVRLTEDYLTRIWAGIAGSVVILCSIRAETRTQPRPAWKEWGSMIRQSLFAPRIKRRILYESLKSKRNAEQMLAELERQSKETQKFGSYAQ